MGRCKAWHSIINIGQHTRSNNVMCDMPSLTLDSRHCGKTLNMAYHHCLWIGYMVRRRRAWHAIMPLAQHTRFDYVMHGHSSPLWIIYGHGMLLSPLDKIHGRTTLALAMLQSPLDSTHSHTTTNVKCDHCPWTIYMVGLYRVWDVIISLGKNTLFEDVGRYMLSSPLDITHDQRMLGVACPHVSWAAHMVGRRQPWQCYNRPWTAHTVGLRLTSNVIIALG